MELQFDNAAIAEMAAQKIANQILDDEGDIRDRARQIVEERVQKAVDSEVGASLRASIDAALHKNLHELLDRQIVPVDIWGDKTGEPTSIRAQLQKRALEFWEERVEKDGKRTTYGGEPRYKVVYKQITEEAFNDAIKNNVTEIVVAFNNALKADCAKLINDHVNNLIKLPRR